MYRQWPRVALTAALTAVLSCARPAQAPTPAKPDPSRSTVTVDRSTGVVANGHDQAVITVTVETSAGTPLSGLQVQLTATGEGTEPSQPALTDATGTTAGTLSSTVAETSTISAIADGIQLSSHPTVQFVAGDATRLAFAVPPSSAQAGTPIAPPIRIEVQDAQGNMVSWPDPITVAIGTNPAGGTLMGTVQAIAVNGMASFPTVSIDAAGSGYTLVASSGSLQSAASAPFDITVGPPAKLAFAIQPSSTVAGSSITPAIQVQLLDAGGNVVTSPSTAVTLALDSPSVGATLAGTLTQIASAGVASFGYLSIAIAGTYTLVATADGYAGATSAPFMVTAGAPSGLTSTFVATPATVTADGRSTAALVLMLEDVNMNSVSGQQVVFSSPAVLSAPACTTNAAGVCMVTLSWTVAAPATVTAMADSLTLNTVVTFAPGAASGNTTSIVASPATVPADGSSVATLTITVNDANGNPVPSEQVVLTTTQTGTHLSQDTMTTGDNGVLTGTISSTVAAAAVVTATLESTAAQVSTVVTFTAGPPNAQLSTIVATPTTLVADGVSTSRLTVTALDANGNPVSGQAVGLTSSTVDLFAPSAGSTNALGVFMATVSSRVAGPQTVLASLGPGIVISTPLTLTPGALSPIESSLVASPVTLPADGMTSTTLTVTALDMFGNPLTGQEVSLAISGPAMLVPNAGSIDSNGHFTATLSSTLEQVGTVTATVGAAVLVTTVDFIAGPPSPDNSTVVASPTSLTADGLATTALTVTVLDANANPVAGQAVSFSATGTGNTFTPSNGTTDGSGVVTARLASTQSGSKTITAAIGSIGVATTVLFLPGAPSSVESTLSANPVAVPADGMSPSTLTLTVLDAQGNAISGQAVSLTSTNSGDIFSPALGFSNATGVFTATVAATQAGPRTITASAGSVPVAATTLSFIAGPASSGSSTLVVSPDTVVADGASTATLTVTVADAQGNPVGGQGVVLVVGGTMNTLSSSSGMTNTHGVFAAALSSTKAESKTITATAGGLILTAQVAFVAGPPAVASSTISAVPATLPADGMSASRITVTLQDVDGNPVSGQQVSLAARGGGNMIVPLSGPANMEGIYTATITSATAGTKTITATAGSLVLPTTVTFTAALAAAESSITASPSSVTADGTSASTITVIAMDESGDPLTGQSIALSASGTGASFPPSSGTVSATGMFTSTVTSTVVGAVTVTAAVAGGTLTTPVTFTPPATDVPMTIGIANGSLRFSVAVQVGDAPPFDAIVDTGSCGLVILPGTVPDSAVTSITQTTYDVTYSRTLTVDSVVALATVTIGGLTSPEPIPVAIVQSETCGPSNPSCSVAAEVADHFSSFSAILGIGLRNSAVSPVMGNPIAQLPGGSAFVIEAPAYGGTTGVLSIGPTSTQLATFQTFALAPQPGGLALPNGLPAWNDKGMPGCLEDLTSGTFYCAGVHLDTGQTGETIEWTSYQGDATNFVSGTDVEVNLGPASAPIGSYSFVVGAVPQQGLDQVTEESTPGTNLINTGTAPFFHYDVLFDQANGLIGLAPHVDSPIGGYDAGAPTDAGSATGNGGGARTGGADGGS